MAFIKTASKSIGGKVLFIFILGFLMLIPMAFIEGVVHDRKGYQADAIDSIIEPIGGNLQLNGILVVVPYTIKVFNEEGIESSITHYMYISPDAPLYTSLTFSNS